MIRFVITFILFQTLLVQASAPSAIEEKVANEDTAVELSPLAGFFRAKQKPALRKILKQSGTGLLPPLNEIIIGCVTLSAAEEKAIEEKMAADQKRYHEVANVALARAQHECRDCFQRDDNRKKLLIVIGVALLALPAIAIGLGLGPFKNPGSNVPCLNHIEPNTNVTSLCWAAHFDRCCTPADYNFIIGDPSIKATTGNELKTFAENVAREQQCDPASLFCLNPVGCDQVNPLYPNYFKNFNPCNNTSSNVKPTRYRRKVAMARDKQKRRKRRIDQGVA